MINDLAQIEAYSKEKVGADHSGHDYYHAKRVAKTAQELAAGTTANQKIVLAAAFLHDVIDDKVTANPARETQLLQEFFKSLSWPESEIDAVFAIINNLSFSKELEFGKQSLSLEGQLVQDADRIDALGAIGILRTAYYGGHTASPLYDETKPRNLATKADYRKKGSVINHFYEKLLKLPETMNTEVGKVEALRRVDFMKIFLAEFYSETGEKKLDFE